MVGLIDVVEMRVVRAEGDGAVAAAAAVVVGVGVGSCDIELVILVAYPLFPSWGGW